jgi:hypothetical protein
MRTADWRLARSKSEAEAGESSPDLFSFGVGARRNFFVALAVQKSVRRCDSYRYLKAIARVLEEQHDFGEFISIPRIESEKTLVQRECASGL